MKVRFLYIFDLGIATPEQESQWAMTRDAEAEAVSSGLYRKYCERCAAVGVLTLVKSKGLTLAHVKGPLPLKDGLTDKIEQQKALQLLDEAPPNPSATASTDKKVADRSIGAYIIMHADSVDAAKVAEHLDNVLPPTAKQKLHYVVMLACGLSRGDDPGTYDLKRSDVPYMNRLMAELKERKMTPVLAGWDVYITAAPHRPGRGHDVYEGASNQKITHLETIPGRKIVQPKDPRFAQLNKEYRTVFNEYRQLHKKVYQIDKDGKLSVKLGTWSQR